MGRRRDFDLLRVICSIAVVYLHVAAPALRQTANMGVWHVSNFLTAVCTAAVPLFFMISGALALGSDKTADVGDLLKRRLWRIAVPFVVWSAIAVGCLYLRDGKTVAYGALVAAMVRPVITPYWFLYAFLSITMLTPLLRRLVAALDERGWKYLLGLWLVFSVCSSTLRGFMSYSAGQWFGWYAPYSLSFLGGMLGYYLLGHWLANLKVTVKAWKFGLVALVSVLVIAIGTRWASIRIGEYSEQFKSYLALPVVVLAVSLFLLARVLWETKTSGKVLGKLAGASFGVYLSHPILMDIIRRAASGETLLQITTLPIQAVYFLVVVAASVLLSLIIQELPGLRYLLLGIRRKKG
ncbi:MAG: acyltransferase [Oscillospiraceae bacterium]|nr:acyltransferase [Oscillospiraceae bacterium]